MLSTHFQINPLERYPKRNLLDGLNYKTAVVKFNSLPLMQVPLINVNHVIKDNFIALHALSDSTEQSSFIQKLPSYSASKIPIYNTLTACMNLFEVYERNNQLGSAILLAEKMLKLMESNKVNE